MTRRLKGPLALAAGAVAIGLSATGVLAQGKWTYPVEVWDPPFDMASPRTTVDYTPLDKAAQKWKICVSFPHMKDAYWLAVDYGVAEEAKRQGVKMQLVEAGGYTELKKQISQIEDCVAARRRGGDHRRDLVRRPEQSRLRDPQEEHPGHRRDQRHLLAGAVGEVAGLVRRDGRQGRRVPGEAASGGRPIRSRSRGSRARPARAGSRPAIPASPRRSRAARSRSSTPNTATPARKCSSSWSRTRSRRIRTSTTSSARR